MLTPKFSLRQNADYLFIQLHVPFMKSENAECDVFGDEFYFSAKPYYLRLHLPGNVINDDRLKSEYDVDKGELNIRVAKEIPGERFEGLDMLTKLLTPKPQLIVPTIEVLQENGHDPSLESIGTKSESEGCTSEDISYGDDVIDWFVEQTIPEENEGILMKTPHYGFAHQKSNAIGNICTELDMIDLKDPDNITVADRSLLRHNQEDDKFDCEHYLADLYDDALIQDVISAEYQNLTGAYSDNGLDDKEKERLMRLPRKEYLIEHDSLSQVYLGLVDLVYTFCYNYRFSGGECNIESDWTICKLSSTLSWFDSFSNLKDVIVSCARRTLCFPLYRSWNLFLKVLSDVKKIFKAGKTQILKCLLGIHSVLEKSESYHPLNDLYITDYCVWIQNSDCKMIDSLAVTLSELKVNKADVGLSIVELEEDAERLMSECEKEDEVEVNELSKKMSNVVHLADADCSDSDDEDNDDGDTESCSQYSSSCSSSSEEEEEIEKVKSDLEGKCIDVLEGKKETDCSGS